MERQWHFELDEQAGDRKSQSVGIIIILFLVIALCYSAVGFGGGSSYTALLIWRGEELETVRAVSLACNLVVTAIGGWMSLHARRVRLSLLGPLLCGAFPGVITGASFELEHARFAWVFGLALLTAGGLLIGQMKPHDEVKTISLSGLLPIGFALGLLAGLTGIGGGIYLVPILHLMRAGKAKEIAAVGTWFILINSALGLSVLASRGGLAPIREFAPLPIAVTVGGLIGAWTLQGLFSALWIKRVTGFLVIVVACRVLFY